jgi:type III secretion protein U
MSGEKNEKPTDKKLDDAKKQGQVAVSQDLAHLVGFVAVAETAFLSEPLWRGAIFDLFNLSMSAQTLPFTTALPQLLKTAGITLGVVFGALLVVVVISSFAGHWGQTGVVLTFDTITPSLDKINPANTIKQLFSRKKLTEFIMILVKSFAIGVTMYILIRSSLPDIISLAGGEPKDIYAGFISLLRMIFHVIVGILLVICIIDFAAQKYVHIKSLMMSLEEIKNEHKETEGDPLIKSMRKRLARELVNSDPVAKTDDANAVVVNPTHFAVAMLYDPETAAVPVVLSKGKDAVAQAMIRRAKERGIPVIRHVWLARTLYATCKEDTVIPRSSYEAAAYVYAVVHELHATNQVDRVVELEMRGEPPPSHRQ